MLLGYDGLCFSFPQTKGEQDGETKYFDMMFLSSLERDHIRQLVVLDLQQQGHIDRPKQERKARLKQTPEDLSEYTSGSQDDIAF